MKLFESVPNFSEGRDRSVIDSVAEAARGSAGVTVLDVEQNTDHNRSVISLVGEGPPLSDALFRMIQVAIRKIDLNHHKGEHPRMGAVDVVPFVPFGDATMEDAVQLAERLAERVWKELQLPVYLYGHAARRPERGDLATVRKGEFEGIRSSIATDPLRKPDFGENRVHPTAGIVAIGARPVLIAYNAYLATADVNIAKKVARSVRGRDGGLAEVKALGFDIAERQRAQVSMNLTDYRKTPMHRALELVRREAARYGVTVEESEIVGLVPEDALLDAAEFYLQLNRFDRGTILERKVQGASIGGGRQGVHTLADLPVREFVARVAAKTPTPGGGSAAAVAGALGSSLGEMVVLYSRPPSDAPEPLRSVQEKLGAGRQRFLELADLDSQAYELVRSSRASRKGKEGDPELTEQWRSALRHAAEIPLETARLAEDLRRALEDIRTETKPALESDLVSAGALLGAARDAALANVSTNLVDLQAAGQSVQAWQNEIASLRRSAIS